MPELTTADVASYTKGRLSAEDAETARLLAAALGAARRYCGWHVTPIAIDDVITLDGSGTTLLVLPTLRLTELTALTEDGIDVDISQISVSTRGLARKRQGYVGGGAGCYWTDQFGGITATMTHGFAEAPEWESAVLSFVERTAGGISVGREVVGPFQFPSATAAGSVFSDAEKMLLDLYRLEDPA